MPNRIIKESICTSENVDSLKPEEEVFFYRLITACDDYGCLDGRPQIIRAKCFPLRVDKVKDKDIAKWLSAVSAAGLVTVYIAEGKPYLMLTTWDKHQQVRAKKRKFPELDANCTILKSSEITCKQLQANVPVIQSNPIQSESYTESNPPDGYTPEFETFWKEYPRKNDKKAAYDKWKARLKEKVTPEQIIHATKNYLAECHAEKREQQFIKMPKTFLGSKENVYEYLNKEPTEGEQNDRDFTHAYTKDL